MTGFGISCIPVRIAANILLLLHIMFIFLSNFLNNVCALISVLYLLIYLVSKLFHFEVDGQSDIRRGCMSSRHKAQWSLLRKFLTGRNYFYCVSFLFCPDRMTTGCDATRIKVFGFTRVRLLATAGCRCQEFHISPPTWSYRIYDVACKCARYAKSIPTLYISICRFHIDTPWRETFSRTFFSHDLANSFALLESARYAYL